MISFLRGYVTAAEDGCAVLDVNGVGYEVRISSETARRLAESGSSEEVVVYTYLYLREDQIALYGFLSREDLELFKLLITVSGVGPKAGLALLSSGTADDLRFAIMTGDVRMISRAPGIGKKTAERLILELRDKVAALFNAEQFAAGVIGGKNSDAAGISLSAPDYAAGEETAKSPSEEAIEALTALGYSRGEASGAVRRALQSQPAGRDDAAHSQPDTETLLKAALKYL